MSRPYSMGKSAYNRQKGSFEKNINSHLHPSSPGYFVCMIEATNGMEEAWHRAAWEMVEASSEEAMLLRWNRLMDELSAQGIDELEARMTERYLEALPRYQRVGYLTDIQTP